MKTVKNNLSKGHKDHVSKENKAEMTKMSRDMESLFELFFAKNNSFHPSKVFSKLKKYNAQHTKILYAPISNMIFMRIDENGPEESDSFLGTISSNINKTYHFTETEKKKALEKSENVEIYDKILISLVKMSDHVDLASNQYKSLKQSDDEFQQKFKKIIKPVKDKLERKINSQLISLIGIFTAMAFLIFGGISVLGNIAYNLQNTPLIKLVLVTSLWGLCIVNMIFTFLFCISKMTKLKLSWRSGSFLTKYPVIWFSNWILITVFIVSSWLYFSDQIGILQIVIDFIRKRPLVIFLAVFIAIILLSLFLIILLLKNYREHSYY